MERGLFRFQALQSLPDKRICGELTLYPEDDDDFIGYDPLINIRPMQGNRSRGADDPVIRQRYSNSS